MPVGFAARGPLALPVEGGDGNLLLFPNAFDNAAWTPTEVTVSANAATDPFAGSEADRLTPSVVDGDHVVEQLTVGKGGTDTYNLSVYIQEAGYNRAGIHIQAYDGATFLGGTWTKLGLYGAGAVEGAAASYGTGTSGGTASVTNPTGSWIWCKLDGVTVSASYTRLKVVIIVCNSAGLTSYAGDGTSGIYVYGARLESV